MNSDSKTPNDLCELRKNELIQLPKINRKKRIGKKELYNLVIEENQSLKNRIIDLQQKISAIETQNETLKDQILFFQNQVSNTQLFFPREYKDNQNLVITGQPKSNEPQNNSEQNESGQNKSSNNTNFSII